MKALGLLLLVCLGVWVAANDLEGKEANPEATPTSEATEAPPVSKEDTRRQAVIDLLIIYFGFACFLGFIIVYTLPKKSEEVKAEKKNNRVSDYGMDDPDYIDYRRRRGLPGAYLPMIRPNRWGMRPF